MREEELDELHPDVIAAIDAGMKSTEVLKIMDLVEVFGSMDNFNKLFSPDKITEEDMKVISNFAKIVSNYIHMNRIIKNKLKEV